MYKSMREEEHGSSLSLKVDRWGLEHREQTRERYGKRTARDASKNQPVSHLRNQTRPESNRKPRSSTCWGGRNSGSTGTQVAPGGPEGSDSDYAGKSWSCSTLK